MSKLLKPERLNLDPQSPNAAKDWKYWFKTFENFIIMCGTDAPDKHLSLINLISSDVYEYLEDCTDYDSVKNTLEKLYVKSPNEFRISVSLVRTVTSKQYRLNNIVMKC